MEYSIHLGDDIAKRKMFIGEKFTYCSSNIEELMKRDDILKDFLLV
jgi:hypothetical protein